MDRGFYTSVSAMMCGTKKLTDISNNIANINTIGYKRDVSYIEQFSDLLINKIDEGNNVGNMINQVNIKDTYTVYDQGTTVLTDIETDYALFTEGFFKIEKNGEYVYTRDGSFKVDAQRNLVTDDGYYVLDKNNNRITVEEGVDYSDELQVVNFDNLQTLSKIGDNLFANEFGLSEEVQVEGSYIKRGYLETSNVDASVELTDLIKTQRYYQFNQRSLSVRDELLEQLAQF